MSEVRALSEAWRVDYNTERPHKSLGYLSPFNYAQMHQSQAALSTPASETYNQMDAQPVVDKAVQKEKTFTSENAN